MGFTACLDCPRDRGKHGFPSNRACDRRHLRPLLEIRGQERSEDYATAITALPAGTPSRHWIRHRGDGVQRLCLAGPDRPYHLGVDHSGHTTGIHARVDRYRSL